MEAGDPVGALGLAEGVGQGVDCRGELGAFRLGEFGPVDVLLAGVDLVGAAQAVAERELEDAGVLLKHPAVGFGAGEAGAVDAGLLAGAEADDLSVGGEADGVGLGVAEGDGGDEQVAAGVGGEVALLGDDVVEELVVDGAGVGGLFEADAEEFAALGGGRGEVGVGFEDQVAAALFGLEQLERVGVVGGGDDAVGDFAAEELGE